MLDRLEVWTPLGLCLENSGCQSCRGQRDMSGSEEQKTAGRPGPFTPWVKTLHPVGVFPSRMLGLCLEVSSQNRTPHQGHQTHKHPRSYP